jgi:uncharacterized coiled-coil DUF342 family protein
MLWRFEQAMDDQFREKAGLREQIAALEKERDEARAERDNAKAQLDETNERLRRTYDQLSEAYRTASDIQNGVPQLDMTARSRFGHLFRTLGQRH